MGTFTNNQYTQLVLTEYGEQRLANPEKLGKPDLSSLLKKIDEEKPDISLPPSKVVTFGEIIQETADKIGANYLLLYSVILDGSVGFETYLSEW